MDFPQRPEADDETDLEAIRRVREGDGNAFSMIVSRYAPVFYSLAFRQIGRDQEAASEAVQEIFLKAYRALPSFDVQRRFFPWLYTIALNHLRSLKRSRKYAQGRNVVPLDSLSGAETAGKTSPPDDAVVAGEKGSAWPSGRSTPFPNGCGKCSCFGMWRAFPRKMLPAFSGCPKERYAPGFSGLVES